MPSVSATWHIVAGSGFALCKTNGNNIHHFRSTYYLRINKSRQKQRLILYKSKNIAHQVVCHNRPDRRVALTAGHQLAIQDLDHIRNFHEQIIAYCRESAGKIYTLS